MLPSKEIDGHLYEVDLFTTTEGLKVWIRLQKIVGSGFAGLLEGAGGDEKEQALASAVGSLVGAMDEDSTIELIKKLCSRLKRDGQSVLADYDMFFRGKYLTLGKVLMFVIEENFFFGKDILQELGKRVDQISEFQNILKSGPDSTDSLKTE